MKLNKKLCSTDLQIVLRTAYEETYGIVNHALLDGIAHEEAFSLVTLNDNENIYKNDFQRLRARRFAMLRVGQYFNISYKHFIELPHADCDMLFELCEELIQKEKPILKDVLEEFQNEIK